MTSLITSFAQVKVISDNYDKITLPDRTAESAGNRDLKDFIFVDGKISFDKKIFSTQSIMIIRLARTHLFHSLEQLPNPLAC